MIVLKSNRFNIRTLVEKDAGKLTGLINDNKKFWAIHEPLHSSEYYTEKAQLKRIVDSVRQLGLSREYSFGIFTETEDLIGHISLYGLKRLPFSSAFIGYSIDERYIGQGIATEAVNCVTRFAFEELMIHRLEAYVSPANTGSVKVLERTGFEREGLLRQLLYINGRWEDHYLYAMLDSRF